MGLAFPTGYRAGFDQAHLAAKGAQFSSVALGANHISLLQGAMPGVNPGGPNSIRTNSILGPTTKFNTIGTLDAAKFSGNVSGIPGVQTFAAIFKVATLGTFGYILTSGSSGSGSAINKSFADVLAFTRYGGTTTSSSLAVAANIPYFAIVSSDNSTVTNLLLLRLDTGLLVTEAGSASATTTSDGVMVVGNSPGANNSFDGEIAATMLSGLFLSIPQMKQWAQNPWAYWYPDAP